MVDDQMFLEIPVYTVAENVFYQGFDAFVERVVEARFAVLRPMGTERDLTRLRAQAESERYDLVRAFGGPWKYNQICGYIGIFPLGDQLRGDAWFQQGRIYKRSTKRRNFEWYGKAFEITVDSEDTSSEIMAHLLREVRALQRERPFKGRYIDLEGFARVGPLVDWRRLVDLSAASSW